MTTTSNRSSLNPNAAKKPNHKLSDWNWMTNINRTQIVLKRVFYWNFSIRMAVGITREITIFQINQIMNMNVSFENNLLSDAVARTTVLTGIRAFLLDKFYRTFDLPFKILCWRPIFGCIKVFRNSMIMTSKARICVLSKYQISSFSAPWCW